MKLNASEQATYDFYQWELLGRGTFLFETPVDIEPPYTSFARNSFRKYSSTDDGKVPSIFERIAHLFKAEPKEEIQELELLPNYLKVEEVPKLKGILLSFSGKYEILSSVVTEFLNILTFTKHSISFEIHGSFEDVKIQIVSSEDDYSTIESQLKAYFPNIITTDFDPNEIIFNSDENVVIADFGLSEEFMRPMARVENYKIDPLTSIIGTVEQLKEGETFLWQTIFKGVSAPWVRDIIYSVSDSKGGSFFSDAPEMIGCAKDKVSQALFSVVMRMAAQGTSKNRSNYLASTLAGHISSLSSSSYNKLIPLSNKGYAFDFHFHNVHKRLSNRLGFLCNTKELATLVHYPNSTIVSEYLHVHRGKTRAIAKLFRKGKYFLGSNLHKGVSYDVVINDEQKLRHSHIIGATGVGKSTLIANMVIDDMNKGNGLFLFDPHGDIVEDVLARVPKHRIDDVIIVDPYDTEFPMGFNLLHANTDAEKIVLSSDVVGAFKRFATSWGDNMSSVLSQAVNTFLESSTGGTLIELKRFLLEDNFRASFLKNVEDPSIHYYWNNEYVHLKKRIAPLLTRIDTFLRPKIVRYMLAQKQGIDFKECIEQKKIVLLKLSQGLIGQENSYLLGSLFLSKINQVALGRQSLAKEQRHPFYVYLDEFQNFITPSISSILSGSRKYGLGLILAHQELAQIDDYQVLNSVLSNPNIRICFKLGDADAKRLNDGFTHFELQDLQSLGIGEAIMRIGSSSSDFNLETLPLLDVDSDIASSKRGTITQNSRNNYAQSKEIVEQILEELLPKTSIKVKNTATKEVEIIEREIQPELKNEEVNNTNNTSTLTSQISEKEKEKLIKEEENSIKNRDHVYLQTKIKKLGQDRGYLATIEKQTDDGGRIDITLEKGTTKIAFEISITNTAEYEVKNIKKCLKHGYHLVVMVSTNRKHLNKIEQHALKKISENDLKRVFFIMPTEITKVLDELDVAPPKNEEIVKGFRVTTEFESSTSNDFQSIKKRITRLLFKKR